MKSVDHNSAEVSGVVNFSASLPHLQTQPPTLKTLKCSKLSCSKTSAGLPVNSDDHSSKNKKIKKGKRGSTGSDKRSRREKKEKKNHKHQPKTHTHTQPQNMGQTSHCLLALSHLLNSELFKAATDSC